MLTNKTRTGIVLTAIVAVVLAVIFASFLGQQNPTKNLRLQVVAAQNFWGNVAGQIGGDKVDVLAIVSDPTVDPHLYESNVRDGTAIAKANIVIQNGLGYDDFVTKLLSASPNPERVVVNVAQLVAAPQNANPHLWYNLGYVSQAAKQVARLLISKDPKNQTYYQTNERNFLASLNVISQVLDAIKAKHAGSPVAYTEPVMAYMLQAAGLQNKTPEPFALAMEEGNEPSAGDQASMVDLLKNHQVKLLIYNVQAESPVTRHMRDVAQQAGVPVVGISETMPKDETYQVWQLRQLDSLSLALNNK